MQVNMLDSTKMVELTDTVFQQPFNEGLVHQLVVKYQANARAGTRAQKTRSEVRGGGKKPWRQKGTGRARAGTIRSPLWRKGGVIFAAKPQDHSQKINKKMYRAAMRSIMSELARQKRLQVIEAFKIEAIKTKTIKAELDKLKLEGSVLLLTHEFEENVYLSSRNLVNVGYLPATDINPVDLIKYDNVLATYPALKHIEEQLAK
ncbi:MAG: 50S ribosomal protein L4 [Pseudomonadota bacterium]